MSQQIKHGHFYQKNEETKLLQESPPFFSVAAARLYIQRPLKFNIITQEEAENILKNIELAGFPHELTTFDNELINKIVEIKNNKSPSNDAPPPPPPLTQPKPPKNEAEMLFERFGYTGQTKSDPNNPKNLN